MYQQLSRPAIIAILTLVGALFVGLILSHAAARLPVSYGASLRLPMMPSKPLASAAS